MLETWETPERLKLWLTWQCLLAWALLAGWLIYFYCLHNFLMCSLSGKATQNIILSNVHTAVPQSLFPLKCSFDKNVPPSQFLLPFMKIREIKSVCRVLCPPCRQARPQCHDRNGGGVSLVTQLGPLQTKLSLPNSVQAKHVTVGRSHQHQQCPQQRHEAQN